MWFKVRHKEETQGLVSVRVLFPLTSRSGSGMNNPGTMEVFRVRVELSDSQPVNQALLPGGDRVELVGVHSCKPAHATASLLSLERQQAIQTWERGNGRTGPACGRCGRSVDGGTVHRCPAINKKCHNCKKIDHFSIACRSDKGYTNRVE